MPAPRRTPSASPPVASAKRPDRRRAGRRSDFVQNCPPHRAGRAAVRRRSDAARAGVQPELVETERTPHGSPRPLGGGCGRAGAGRAKDTNRGRGRRRRRRRRPRSSSQNSRNSPVLLVRRRRLRRSAFGRPRQHAPDLRGAPVVPSLAGLDSAPVQLAGDGAEGQALSVQLRHDGHDGGVELLRGPPMGRGALRPPVR